LTDGRTLSFDTYGSASCPPVIRQVQVAGPVVTVRLKSWAGRGCTLDALARRQAIRLANPLPDAGPLTLHLVRGDMRSYLSERIVRA